MPSISVKEFLIWKKKQLFKGGDHESFAFLVDCMGGISTADINLLSINIESNLIHSLCLNLLLHQEIQKILKF